MRLIRPIAMGPVFTAEQLAEISDSENEMNKSLVDLSLQFAIVQEELETEIDSVVKNLENNREQVAGILHRHGLFPE